MRRSGSSWGFGALLKGLTSVVDNSCRSRDSNPQPRVTSPALYPLEPRLPHWCTDNSFSSLPVNLSQVFESALLDLILKLACAPFPTPFLPVSVAFNMLWCSTLWTATPFCDFPSLWSVSMIVFWTIAKSAVFSIIVVSKNKRFILYGWSFIETQM